ncbi:MAG: TIGR03790 family protein [Verrucomicrobiota bacterium]
MKRVTAPPYSTVSFAILCFCIFLISPALSQHLDPSQILVIYNKADSDSKKLADFYQVARQIPTDQILGLTLPNQKDISRKEYETTLLKPLREHFTKENWWKRSKDQSGVMRPTQNRIRAIVLMHGVPLRIKAEPVAAADAKLPPNQLMANTDQASIDSELMLFGVDIPTTKGAFPNAFFSSPYPLSKSGVSHLVLVNRIDAPTFEVCRRMIIDAVATEKHGLWGRAYIDISNKFPQGDAWLENIVSENLKLGIPTVTDRFNDTLPKNYPMSEAAMYYGWYERDVNGPFLNPTFKFRPGAVAFHIHSFSAEQMTDANKNWSAALLTRGATATVGNVYEPFLHQSHQLNILHDRLLKGWTFAEAAGAAINVSSWQGIALGDPLYRPFLHFNGTGEVRKEDRDFRILRAASREWPKDEALRFEKLTYAHESLSSGAIAESLANEYLAKKDIPNSQAWLKKARDSYQEKPDKLRQDLQLIAIERSKNQHTIAIQLLQSAQKTYSNIPEVEALSKWLEIVQKSSAAPN